MSVARGADPVARLRGRVAQALTALADDGEVQSPGRGSNGDGAVSLHYGGAPCAVHVAAIADGLVMVSMTCVVGWDLPAGPGLDAGLAAAREAVQFGALRAVHRGDEADVVLQYPFPATGLDDAALRTMLTLVLGGASEARSVLAAHVG